MGKPTFLGLSPEDADPSKAAAVILPVPFDATSTWKKGADRGPDAIIDASTQVELYDIETASEPYRNGIWTAPPIECGHDDPVRLADDVSQHVARALDRKQLPVVLGGEHSVSIGAIQECGRRFDNLSVLQIDAHGDTRPAYHGSTHNHACVMARALECAEIVQVGIRAVDRSEITVMDPDRVFFAHDIARSESDAWMDRVVNLLTPRVYITIDLDAFDPSILPATGTPEPGGLDWYTVNELVRRVIETRTVVAFDVVELLPMDGHHASSFLAAKLVHRLLAMVFRQRNQP